MLREDFDTTTLQCLIQSQSNRHASVRILHGLRSCASRFRFLHFPLSSFQRIHYICGLESSAEVISAWCRQNRAAGTPSIFQIPSAIAAKSIITIEGSPRLYLSVYKGARNQPTFYLLFSDVAYIEAPMSWLSAEFDIAEQEDCIALMLGNGIGRRSHSSVSRCLRVYHRVCTLVPGAISSQRRPASLPAAPGSCKIFRPRSASSAATVSANQIIESVILFTCIFARS